jgi:hypothetical protein
MWNPLTKLFSKPPERGQAQSAPGSNDREYNPVVTAKFTGDDTIPIAVAAACEGPGFWLEYDEFCEGFEYQPGKRLMKDYVLAEDDRRLSTWLDWQGREPEPKAIMRLMLAMMRSRENIWDKPNLVLFRQGQWSAGGGPSPASQECLSVMAQLIGKMITVSYKSSQDAPDTDLKTLRFEP